MNTLNTVMLILGIGVVLIIGWIIAVYNGLITLRNRTQEAWSDIDVQLKRRYDLIPNLVETVKGYARHESQTMEKVIQARAAAMGATGTAARAEAENALSQTLKSLFAVAENYPDLKANASFGSLQQRISELENQIADRREFYNDTVTIFNTRIQQIPDSWVAGGMNLQPAELFKIDERDREDVKIEFKLSA